MQSKEDMICALINKVRQRNKLNTEIKQLRNTLADDMRKRESYGYDGYMVTCGDRTTINPGPVMVDIIKRKYSHLIIEKVKVSDIRKVAEMDEELGELMVTHNTKFIMVRKLGNKND